MRKTIYVIASASLLTLSGSASAAVYTWDLLNSPAGGAANGGGATDLEVVFSGNILGKPAPKEGPGGPGGTVTWGGAKFADFVKDVWVNPLKPGSTVQLIVNSNVKGLTVKNAVWTGIPNFDVPGTHDQLISPKNIQLVPEPETGPVAAAMCAIGLLVRRRKAKPAPQV